MTLQSQPSMREIRAKNWAWSSFGVAVGLNFLAGITDLDSPCWFVLRAAVSVVFTASLLAYLVLRVQRSRARRSRRNR
ncbi:hypothetical protein [Streptomyces venezuelae]|uniref:hypothetical protein n=1 Tax=Streptomyces venezuelae TaxID=54571 RepID=UPI00379CE938